MDSETTLTFSPSASASALLTILFLLAAIFGSQVSLRFSLAAFGIAIITSALAFLFQYRAAADDEDREASVLKGSALVDERAIAALTTAGMLFRIIRAVERVGSKESVESFRTLLREECLFDITEEQLDIVTDIVRVRSLPIPAAAMNVVSGPSPSGDVGPSTPEMAREVGTQPQ